MQELGRILSEARQARGLSLEAVARQLGYRDLKKGVRRLSIIEATGQVKDDLLLRLLEVFGIDWADFEETVIRLRQQSE